MSDVAFDALAYFEKLKAAGVPEVQAKAQAEGLREAMAEYDKNRRQELATKADLREVELRLQNQIEKTKNDLLKWQFGIAIALALIMAKGFNWLGF